MALVLKDRVRDTTTTAGTGTVTLSGTAPTGFQNFSAIGNGNTTYYTISGGNEWEVGIGTYSSTGPTLSRDTVLASSASGAKVTFSAGTKDVFVTYPAGKAISDGYGTLPAANGGTGLTSPGTSGNVLTSNGTAWTSSAPLSDVQVFTSSGTWTKPAGAQTVTVICIGGGGGGGSGCKGAAGTLRSGGGGGGGGGYSVTTFKASDIAASVSVTVGAGGTSGASQTVNSSNGNAGGAGGNTTFGNYVASRGGTGGNGGIVNNSSATAVGGAGVFGSASAGAGSIPNSPTFGQGAANGTGGAGGAAGGGITSSNVIVKGGQGCNTSSNTEPRWIDPASNSPTSDTVTGAGNSGTDLTSASWFGGESGDGGNASSTGNAFAGGNGGKWGGGAGGGGAALDSVGNSGAGGTGGSGLCVVITE